MNIDWALIIAPLAGLGLGVIFFGGLWWTLRHALLAAHPAPLLLGSLLLRVGVTLAGFYFVAAGQAGRMLLCLLGFVVARFLVVGLTREKAESGGRREGNAGPESPRVSHAP